MKLKQKRLVTKLSFLFLFSILITGNCFCCRIENGYKSLSIYNYFKAKNIFNNIQTIEKGAPIGIQGGNTINANPIQAFGNKSAQR